MNRAIKYRLWDNENNEYWEPTYRAYEGKLEDITLSRLGQLIMRTLEGTEPIPIIDERFVIEQFTGIKDRNGTDIYFGDKLIFTDKLEWYRGAYWPKVALGVMTREQALKEIDNKPYEERLVEDIEDYDWLLSDEIQTYWEVAGNIHQPFQH